MYAFPFRAYKDIFLYRSHFDDEALLSFNLRESSFLLVWISLFTSIYHLASISAPGTVGLEHLQ